MNFPFETEKKSPLQFQCVNDAIKKLQSLLDPKSDDIGKIETDQVNITIQRVITYAIISAFSVCTNIVTDFGSMMAVFLLILTFCSKNKSNEKTLPYAQISRTLSLKHFFRVVLPIIYHSRDQWYFYLISLMMNGLLCKIPSSG